MSKATDIQLWRACYESEIARAAEAVRAAKRSEVARERARRAVLELGLYAPGARVRLLHLGGDIELALAYERLFRSWHLPS